MNGPFLARLAPSLETALAGRRSRYVLAKSPAAPKAPVFLIRFEPPSGTLLVSLRREIPCIALLAEGTSPDGEKDSEAARLAEILGDRAVRRASVPAIDRSLSIEWEGGLLMRVDLFPPRPALHLVEGERKLLTLPERGGRSAGDPLPPLPGADRPDPLQFDPESIPGALSSAEEARAFLRAGVRGLPPEWTEEMLLRSRFEEIAPVERREALIDAWQELLADFEMTAGAYLYLSDEASSLSTVPLRSIAAAPEVFRDPLHAAAVWWKRSDDAVRRGDALRTFRASAKRERKRLLRLVAGLRGDLADAERAPLLRKQAEILSIHFREVEKGAASVRLPDPYEGGEIEIPLDRTKSSRQNIERLFQRAKKGERGADAVRERITEAERRLASIDALFEEAERSASADEAESLLARLRPLLRAVEKRPAWKERAQRGKSRDLPARPRAYVVTGGYTVLVGRDDRENDLLTLKIARPGDLWFHAEQAAGSHVVLLREDPKKPVPPEALLEAASIAARYSKAKHSSKVPVVYTEKRYVRKPRGWPPGKVTCTREKTLFVEPRLPGGQDSGGL